MAQEREQTRPRKKLWFDGDRAFPLPDRSEDFTLNLDSAVYAARKGQSGDRR